MSLTFRVGLIPMLLIAFLAPLAPAEEASRVFILDSKLMSVKAIALDTGKVRLISIYKR